jgi:hypothetical protein
VDVGTGNVGGYVKETKKSVSFRFIDGFKFTKSYHKRYCTCFNSPEEYLCIIAITTLKQTKKPSDTADFH